MDTSIRAYVLRMATRLQGIGYMLSSFRTPAAGATRSGFTCTLTLHVAASTPTATLGNTDAPAAASSREGLRIEEHSSPTPTSPHSSTRLLRYGCHRRRHHGHLHIPRFRHCGRYRSSRRHHSRGNVRRRIHPHRASPSTLAATASGLATATGVTSCRSKTTTAAVTVNAVVGVTTTHVIWCHRGPDRQKRRAAHRSTHRNTKT